MEIQKHTGKLELFFLASWSNRNQDPGLHKVEILRDLPSMSWGPTEIPLHGKTEIKVNQPEQG